MSRTLTLRVKEKWFNEIKAGTKQWEYRQIKPHWIKALYEPAIHSIFENMKRREYDQVHIVWGYKPNSATEWHLFFPWRGFEIHEIKHEEFQHVTQKVFAIRLQPHTP